MAEVVRALITALQAVVDDADDTGCDDCYVVSADVIKKARRALKKAEQANGRSCKDAN